MDKEKQIPIMHKDWHQENSQHIKNVGKRNICKICGDKSRKLTNKKECVAKFLCKKEYKKRRIK